jgi:hypothetical protein
MNDNLEREIDALWRTLSKPASVWLTWAVVPWLAVDLRVLGNRIDRLALSKRGASILEILKGVDPMKLQRLAALARINDRRAQAGFRVTAILNLSAPIAYTAAAAQMMPNGFESLVRELAAEGLLTPLIVGLVALILSVVSFAYLRAREAADLVDLLDLASARAGRGADVQTS